MGMESMVFFDFPAWNGLNCHCFCIYVRNPRFSFLVVVASCIYFLGI
jgi:hypothetical protein